MCVVVGGWTPTPGLYFSWTPWNLVWPESRRDFSKAWTSQQTLPGNWLNSLLYSITLWTNPRGVGGTLMRPSQGFWGTGEKGIYFRGTKAKIWGEERNKKIFGNREHKKTNFRFFGNRGTSQVISGEQGNRNPPGGPLWYFDTYIKSKSKFIQYQSLSKNHDWRHKMTIGVRRSRCLWCWGVRTSLKNHKFFWFIFLLEKSYWTVGI